MGNSATKEQRPPHTQPRSDHSRRSGSPSRPNPTSTSYETPVDQVVYTSRHSRGSRSELASILGIGGNPDRSSGGVENRRETKPEREARKLEKERVAREKERERSVREESVDGGYLVTQGVYTGTEDYNKVIVRHLMIERRMAPFWRGLNDHSSSWTEHQLKAAARGLSIPAADEVPTEDLPQSFAKNDSNPQTTDQSIKSLTVPISSRSQSYNSDSSSNISPSRPTFPLPSSSIPGTALLRGRAKTLASLTSSAKNAPQPEMMPREMSLPKDPYVNGQPIEAYLYKDAAECPICFLYYPPYLNRTRCCDQSICSECFVQIKRPDPHQPEHADPTLPPPPPPSNSDSPGPGENESDSVLVSEPASCPFCVQPEFGITYEPPPFRRGLTYINQASTHQIANITSAMSSNSSLSSFRSNGGQSSPTTANRRRTTSVSANASTVITTDRVRPDWAIKLSNARAHAARRSAAATALHSAAYLMGNRHDLPDARSFGSFGRRGMLRRATGSDSPSGGIGSTHLNMLALMSERYTASAGERRSTANSGESSPTIIGPPRESSRRNRMEDLEDMMMMEAIRLSLASEDDRRKREDKEAKKEAKKKVKEDKKAEKAARKASAQPPPLDNSLKAVDDPQETGFVSGAKKGKAIADSTARKVHDLGVSSTSKQPTSTEGFPTIPQSHLEQSRAYLQPTDTMQASQVGGSSSYKPSHLRNLSNVSSSASSIVEGASDYQISQSSLDLSPNISGVDISARDSPGGEAAVEPVFSFRSLDAMIDNEDKIDMDVSAEHTEDNSQRSDRYGREVIGSSHAVS